jgi:hypothetical protein
MFAAESVGRVVVWTLVFVLWLLCAWFVVRVCGDVLTSRYLWRRSRRPNKSGSARN